MDPDFSFSGIFRFAIDSIKDKLEMINIFNFCKRRNNKQNFNFYKHYNNNNNNNFNNYEND